MIQCAFIAAVFSKSTSLIIHVVYYIIFVLVILNSTSRIILQTLNWKINSKILGMVGNMIWHVFIIEF